jgi:hydrocephalus-inducing protein
VPLSKTFFNAKSLHRGFSSVIEWQQLTCQLFKIKYLNSIQEWNERHKTVKWIRVDEEEERRLEQEKQRMEEEKAKKSLKSKAKLKKKVDAEEVSLQPPKAAKFVSKRIEDVNPEPNIEIIQEIASKMLKVSALADYPKFECTAPSNVTFKLTKMFESRSFTFIVKNTGRIKMQYTWESEENSSLSSFSIEPLSGILAPQTEETFVLKYSPTDVGDHLNKFKCIIKNSKQELPSLQVSGSSVCPIVHFELSPSDYLTNGRRTSDSKGPGGIFGPLDKSTKCVEIDSCGIKIRNTKRFYILNPTDSSYQFEWKRMIVQEEQLDSAIFNCSPNKGIIQSGKKVEIAFEYIPASLQTSESFWLFTIPEKKVNIPFIVVGHAKEPELYFDTPRVNFQTVLVDKVAKKTIKLINRESIPFSFSFDESIFANKSGDSETSREILTVSPCQGTVGTQEELPINITFTPSLESQYNFTLICRIRKKPTLLTCNVKGEGFKIHGRLELESLAGRTILAAQLPMKINFDRVHINEKKVKRIIIFNDGNYNFDFSWHHANNPVIHIEPETGTVEKKGRYACDLVFNPTYQVNLDYYKCVCKITNGGTYVIYINGSGTKPRINFGFTQYDFGSSFLYYNGISPKTVILDVRNDDDKDLSYETVYENQSHFEIEAAATVLKPKETKKIPITFKPTEIKSYKEVITFEVNSIYKVPITLMGEGASARIDLWNPADKIINFGPLQIGDVAETTIYIVNKSKIPARITFPQEMYVQMAKHFVSISTKKEDSITLEPKAKYPITIYFKPEVRLSTWIHELILQVAGRSKSIATITGACQGIEVKLNTSLLSFGPIVKGTQISQRVVLENRGDIGAKYQWNVDKISSDFSIQPLKGFVAANSEIVIEITYSPTKKSKVSVNSKAQCIVEGFNRPLLLSLTGSCKEKATDSQDKVNFKINVRQTQKKTVKLTNPTKMDWKLRSEIDNPCFSGAEYVEIQAGQTKDYEIIYSPSVLTKEKQLDYGTLFFARPDGEAYSFSLVGESIDPLPISEINVDIFAKEQFVQHLYVENWLERAQRFKVSVDLNIKPPDYVKAVDYVDVPPLGRLEYKYTFFSFKEGTFSGKIYFRNEQTNEFQYYNMTYNVKAPRVLQTLTFESIVRQKLYQSVNIENPLKVETKLSVKCNSKDIIAPQELVIAASSVGRLDICYLPLIPSDTSKGTQYEEVELTFSNAELGLYPFKLLLKALPAGPEKNIHYNVSLGNSMTQIIRFFNYSPVATEFSCKLESNDFTMQDMKVIKLQAGGSNGKEESIEVTYEPSQIGECRDKLVLSSKIGGDYTFLLYGHCTAPRPQGPFEINIPNGSTIITFKNVLNKKMDYKFSVDQENFVVKPENASLGSKQKIQITVSFRNSNTAGPPVQQQRIYGKLTVTPKERAMSQVQWIYYLLGKAGK